MSPRALALLLPLLLAGCGDDGGNATPLDAQSPDAASPDAAVKTPDAGATHSTVRLHLPAGFTGTTRQLMLVVSRSVPLAGPPAGVLYTERTPSLSAGQTRTLEVDASTIQGTYYVVAVLFMQGGGQQSPMSGVDYYAYSSHSFNFTGAPLDLGQLDLALAP